MGQKLSKLYDYAEKQGGLPLKMRIAMKTGVSSNQAAAAVDTDDLLNKAKAVIKEATGRDAPAV